MDNLGNGNCRVDFVDVAIMMGHWLEEYRPLGTIDFHSIMKKRLSRRVFLKITGFASIVDAGGCSKAFAGSALTDGWSLECGLRMTESHIRRFTSTPRKEPLGSVIDLGPSTCQPMM